jgi:hypothetical protein
MGAWDVGNGTSHASAMILMTLALGSHWPKAYFFSVIFLARKLRKTLPGKSSQTYLKFSVEFPIAESEKR